MGNLLYDKLWVIPQRANWHLVTGEYSVFAVGALVIAAILIWYGIRTRKRMQWIETKLIKMEKRINTLEMQESRRLMTELNTNSQARNDPRDAPYDAEVAGATATMSPESAKPTRLRQ